MLLLGGGDIGCIELFGNPRVSAIRDLKGKAVLVYSDPAHGKVSAPPGGASKA